MPITDLPHPFDTQLMRLATHQMRLVEYMMSHYPDRAAQLNPPACQFQSASNCKTPGWLEITATLAGNTVKLRVCRDCLYEVTKELRQQKYYPITVTAPEFRVLPPHRG